MQYTDGMGYIGDDHEPTFNDVKSLKIGYINPYRIGLIVYLLIHTLHGTGIFTYT